MHRWISGWFFGLGIVMAAAVAAGDGLQMSAYYSYGITAAFFFAIAAGTYR